ncbi:MAG: hypothetical protein ACI4S1_01095 [Roseburia sp.]
MEFPAIETIIQNEDSVQMENGDWECVLAEDYFEILEYQNIIEEVVIEQIIDTYELRQEEWDIHLMTADLITMSDGTRQKLYLFWHKKGNDPTSMTYSGILMNYVDGNSTLLFQTDKLYDDSSFDSFHEFYDMQICDIDGNGEEDILLLLGTHVSTGTEYYLPNLFCMIGLQENNEFQFVTNRNQGWLELVMDDLYRDDSTNWKIPNILEGLKEYYGNTNINIIEKARNSQGIAPYVDLKESIIMTKIDRRSLYYDRELLWEKAIKNDENGMQRIKVYKEFGEQGCSANVRISVYVFDYIMEEAELQAVPALYAELSKKYSDMDRGYLTDINLDKIVSEDVNGDNLEDIKMTIYCIIKNAEQKEMKGRYEIVYFQSKSNSGMKLFDEVSINELDGLDLSEDIMVSRYRALN